MEKHTIVFAPPLTLELSRLPPPPLTKTLYETLFMCSACQDNMHVTLGAKCMLYACQNKGSMHSARSRSNRHITGK